MSGFGGKTYSEERDGDRLRAHLKRVLDFLIAHYGQELTPDEIAIGAEVSLKSVGSRVRDLRKQEFGGYHIPSKCVGGGLWVYTFEGKAVQPFEHDEYGQGFLPINNFRSR